MGQPAAALALGMTHGFVMPNELAHHAMRRIKRLPGGLHGRFS